MVAKLLGEHPTREVFGRWPHGHFSLDGLVWYCLPDHEVERYFKRADSLVAVRCLMAIRRRTQYPNECKPLLTTTFICVVLEGERRPRQRVRSQ